MIITTARMHRVRELLQQRESRLERERESVPKSEKWGDADHGNS